MTRLPIALSVAAVLALAAPAHAQTSAEDRAAADALYEESGVLIKAKRFAEACPKLETSQRLDPGIGTLLLLGYCYEQIGRTASAWSAYNEGAALALKGNDKRADDAAGRAKALEPKLSRLLIAPPGSTAGLEVRRDGKLVDPGLFGIAVPVDPGEHTLEASAPGKQPWKGSTRVEAGPGTTTIAIPLLLAAVDVPKGADAPKAADAPSSWSGQRTGGVVVGSAGVVGLAVGAVLGALALKKASDLKSSGLCNADLTACYAAGMSGWQDGQALAHGSTAALVIGGAALVAGVVLIATGGPGSKAPSSAGGRWVTVASTAGAGMGSLVVKGGW